MSLVYSLLGFVRLKFDKRYANDVLNVCMEELIPYTDIELDESEGISMTFKHFDYKRLRRIAESRGIELERIKVGGLPSILYKLRYRFGLMAGILCGVLLVIYFSSIIWDVRIEGNTSVTTGEIEDILASYGVCAGEPIRRIDVDKVQNRILIESDKISFIAMNLSGNIASVEIRENKRPIDRPSGIGFANVIAKKSGVIEDVRSYVGNVMVKSGQTVNAGDILISGLYDSKVEGFRYTRAAGEVMAKTVEEYYIEIPFDYEEKCYTGVVNYEKSLNFFGKTFNIFKKGGKGTYLYDTIYNVDSYALMGNATPPISLSTVSYHEYENVSATRSVEEAEELAYLELERKISQSGAEFLIKKTVTPKVNEDSFSIHCVMVYIENIAMTNEFFVDLEN